MTKQSQNVSDALENAKRAAGSSGGSSNSAWVGPKLVVSGATVVTIACPLATDGASRVPCLPPSALVFVGGVQATVVAVAPQFDVAQVQLPEQQSVCGAREGANSTGASSEDSTESSPGEDECGLQAILIVPPPLRASDGSAHPAVEWPPVLDWLQTDVTNTSSASSVNRRSLQLDTNASSPSSSDVDILWVQLDVSTARITQELCNKEALVSQWKAAGGRAAATGGEM